MDTFVARLIGDKPPFKFVRLSWDPDKGAFADAGPVEGPAYELDDTADAKTSKGKDGERVVLVSVNRAGPYAFKA